MIIQKHEPSSGKVLISDPFLPDANFSRTVVLLAAHDDDGTFGFVLNQLMPATLNQLFEDLEHEKTITICKGGPVQLDTLHFIHTDENLKESSKEILPGLFWGGDFEYVKLQIKLGILDESKFKFFLGYSGWGAHQLADEIEEGSWVVSELPVADIMGLNELELWKNSMRSLGGEYAILANAPLNPQWN